MKAHFELGKAHAATEQHKKAIKIFRKVVQLDSQHTEVFLHLGDILFATNNTDPAQKSFERACQITQTRQRLIINLEKFMRRITLKMPQKNMKLRRICESNAESFISNLECALRKTSYQEALTEFQKALEIDSNDAETYYQMGICHLNLRHFSRHR